MSTKTWSAAYDNTSMHPLLVPKDVSCVRITMRQQAQDPSPVAYDVAAPSVNDTAYRKFAGEPTIFTMSLNPSQRFTAGSTFGGVQPTAGTVTFTFIGED